MKASKREIDAVVRSFLRGYNTDAWVEMGMNEPLSHGEALHLAKLIRAAIKRQCGKGKK